ncbi:MAG: class I SAM-dependent methyltransferase [Candidatus Woesearchaeota archaeon]|jgi:SAM-dependent methyltransferase|nr:class I SAM-dependent methyltransferase [Candidatus Woesearchaeota archaeon]
METINNSCKNCKYLDKKNKKCKIESGSPIRKYVIGINKNFVEYLSKQKKEVSVLEIGCGSWSYLKENLPKNVKWHGIDPLDIKDGKKSIATKKGSVEKIPYNDNMFDFVFSNQSMEHWIEYGVTFNKALSEISRILKIKGEAHINVPIFRHGHKVFVKGDKKEIINLFDSKSWKIEKYEEWRKDPRPLEIYEGWRAHRVLCNYFKTKKSSWILNLVISKKKNQMPTLKDKFAYNITKLNYYMLPLNIRLIMHYGVLTFLSCISKKFFGGSKK